MVSKYYRYILLFVFCLVITFLYNFFLLNVNCDEIWNYGFSYNISKGMIIYRDFNVLQTPIFFFIGSIFIMVFGNHIYAYDIYISVIIAILTMLCYKKWGKTAIILLFVFIPNLAPSYNALCVLLVILILFINDKNFKYKDFVIGFFVAVLFLTKQKIGIVIFFVLLFFNKSKFRFLSGFAIPCLMLSIYLIYFDAFYEFIDYCFLGMFSFGNSNFVLSLPYFIIWVIICFILFIDIVKNNFSNVNYVLILVFQIMAYPIFDRNHVMLGGVMFCIYLFYKYYDKIKIRFRYIFLIVLFYFISLCTLPKENYHLYKDSNSFLRYKALYGSKLHKMSLYDDVVIQLKDVIKKYGVGYDNIYIYSIDFSELSYVCKLDLNYKIDKFDYILNGNMGYDGENRFVNDLEKKCKASSCLFVIDNNSEFNFSQTSRKIYDYVISNYNKVTDINNEFINYFVYKSK